MKILRPTMISVLKENTRGLTHMNRKQMWKIIEENGLVDQALELEKHMKRKVGSGRFLENQLRLLTLKQIKLNISQVYQKLPNILGKLKIISYTKMGEFGRIKKLL